MAAFAFVGFSHQGVNMNGNPVVEIIRAIARPAVTVIFAAVIAQVVVDKIDAPEWFLGLAGTCILWWFGQKTAERIKGNKE